MQLTLHAARPAPHGASRLVQALPSWPVKPDVLRPGILGMRGRVHGHTTAAMHDSEYAPPPNVSSFHIPATK